MPKQKDQTKYNLRSRNKDDEKRKHRSGESSDEDDESEWEEGVELDQSYDQKEYKKFLKEIIIESVFTKLKYTKDFRERKTGRYSRAILNYGHTFGHAIESMNSFKGTVKHGEAVAMGMIFEMKVSSALNLKPNSINDLEKACFNDITLEYR